MIRSLKERLRDPADLLFALLLAAAAAAGLYARFRGLGSWPVSYDEYFTGKAVRGVLENGVPRLANGGYYTRGILLQYLAALARLAGCGEELSLRLAPAVFNLLGLPALFLLARKTAGFRVACLAGAAYLLSSWEIEFARFGRMYAPFQALVMWFLYFLHGLVVEKRESCRAWVGALAFASIFVHEGAVIVIALSFLPAFLGGERIRVRHLLVPALSLAAAYLYNTYDFGALKTGRPVASGAVRAGAGKLVLPTVLALGAFRSGGWAAAAGAVLALNLFAVRAVVVEKGLAARAKWVFSIAVLLCYANCIGAALFVVALAYLGRWIGRGDFRWSALRLPAAAALCDLALWAGYLVSLPSFQRNDTGMGPAGTFALVFLLWPDIYRRIVMMWATVLPGLLAATVLLMAAWPRLRDAAEPPAATAGRRLLALVAVAVCGLVGVLRTQYVSTRYSFILLPLVLLLDLSVLRDLARRFARPGWPAHAALLASAAALLFVSGDIRAAHLFRADSPEVNFRMGFRDFDVHHYVPRFDYRSAAQFVDANRAADDRVVSTVLQADFYLKKPMDLFYINGRDREYRNHFDRKTGRERWTGVPLVADERALHESILRSERVVWLVTGSPEYPFNKRFHNDMARIYGQFAAYTGRDGTIRVYRVAPAR